MSVTEINGVIKNELVPTNLLRGDFRYELPKELIAQHPAQPRDSSRLMVLDRESGGVSHRIFRDVGEYLRPGDVLVVNDSKVIPARLYGIKESSGITIETLLLRRLSDDLWETIMRPGRRAKRGTVITYGDGRLKAEVADIKEDGAVTVRFNAGGAAIYAILDDIGNMPLPPYITEKLADKSSYQTVYAKTEGSAAAPTAGLHFTEELLGKIKASGVAVVPVMLHVGLGTFRPVKEERITDHIMHSEYFSVTEESAEAINSRKGRLIAVGTTSCRVLETVADDNGKIRAATGDTGIFIYPGYRFKAVEGMITNFHLPESTLLMLVSAFTSRDMMLNAYREAVEMKYRFFSFGDAMLII